jgi:orotate phosphoribosyltransferase
MSQDLAPPSLETPVLDHLRQALALRFWQARAVRINIAEPFELASGNRSPIYVNCRQVISDPAFMALFTATARLLLARDGAPFAAAAGGETAGIPFAAYLARDLGLPMLYVRKKAKGHGIASKVEGVVPQGERVLLVEDLITDGGSKLGFVDALREAGALVEDALVLFDRQQGGAETLARHGVRLHGTTDLATVLKVAEIHQILSPRDSQAVEDYLRDPQAWHEARGLAWQGSDS